MYIKDEDKSTLIKVIKKVSNKNSTFISLRQCVTIDKTY
jgi:hypothetical protein